MIEVKHVGEEVVLATIPVTKEVEHFVGTTSVGGVPTAYMDLPNKPVINNLPPEATMAGELVSTPPSKKPPVDTFPEIDMSAPLGLPFKYNENNIVTEIRDYLLSTYGQHYAGRNNTQVQDLVIAGSPEETIGFWKWNAVKYLARYGRKNGRNRQDLLKAVHYCVLLLYLDDELRTSELKEPK